MDGNFLGNLGKLSVDSALAKKTETLAGRTPAGDAAERRKVAQEFTAFLYQEVLKAMRAALPGDGLGEAEPLSRDIYTAMLDAEIAKAVAKRDSGGFVRSVERALDRIAPPAMAPSEVKPPAAGVVSSVYGLRQDPFSGEHRFHHGIDIAAPAGTPVKAAAPGTVVFSGRAGGYGNLIEIDHGDGLVTRYGHNAENLVAAGERIEAGQRIALVGRTGRATAPHLHFEVRQGGKPVDPGNLIGEVIKGARVSSVI
jgi:murein DD-endopeptidase MepM/ murein hydrolase activator NlpD